MAGVIARKQNAKKRERGKDADRGALADRQREYKVQDAPLKESQPEYLISHLRAPVPSYLLFLYQPLAAGFCTVNLKSHTEQMQIHDGSVFHFFSAPFRRSFLSQPGFLSFRIRKPVAAADARASPTSIDAAPRINYVGSRAFAD